MLAFAAGLQRIWLRFWQGRSVEVLHPLEVISRTFAGSPTAHLVLARCYVDLARMEEARIELERALLNGALEVPFDGEWILIHALAAEIVHLLDAAPCARPLYDKLRPYADRMAIGSVATLPTGSVSRALGLLAATLGSLDLAIDHLEAAVLQHESIESPPLLAWTLVDMARVLERRHAAGDPARSRRLARAALGIGRKLGMQRLAASAEELL
jgi:tetratricopeptide (TPR) repeat protein